ncbi:TPA: alpha/beta hydrolase [Aeromonas salmonicida]|uniref:alpha/beta fold hydrolase n=1 Tax=Aeromonas salmonicida TaxID=645 RepID=UPI00031C4651|nr:alpha/beta hydrolase [Aeromonas salmonicida]ASI22752.1 alpha/beta hydrolase [Aeromonas salmonicida]ASI27068.1 alpha/beta hydrolase [Aeromonas salmonicida]ASI31186.1 alpha/beta hydrolase [Aeromonas salmonicida]ELI6405857.1 alpha/beta hydrolase [Aeromonas salmonicida subsp. salmonicida]ELI6418669.1 alpha/beta hydrolase [Aeromonas salmonicida subsp. salmonicida]
MKTGCRTALTALSLLISSGLALAAPAIEVLGKDFVFPNRLEGLPARLSDFKGLQINRFTTSDDVTLSYWEAGSGHPLVFIPGWSANGAEYINLMFILAKHYRVIVLDPRNQGLSDKVGYGNRIARYAMDLKELNHHLNIRSADYCGWSMGASVLWSYIDLFGGQGIRKAVFVDEPVAIVARAHWSAQERRDTGALMPSADRLIEALQAPVPKDPDPQTTHFLARSKLRDSPYFVNSERFGESVIHQDPAAMMQVMYDHGSNDWRDVLRHKIRMPVAIFSGEYSANLASQRWAQSVIPGAKLYVYTNAEQGDHFLMFKNPFKFTQDLREFLEH